MNREIKFRVWDAENNEFCPTPEGQTIYNLIYRAYFYEDKYVFQQFTGLKDKNGKEIYEGDILRGASYEPPVEVIFESGCFVINTNPKLPFYNCSEQIWMEVIGNIFENPEVIVKTA